MTNTATASGNGLTSIPASATISLPASADLGLAKTDGTGSVTAGTSTTYTVTLTNHGPDDRRGRRRGDR